MKAARLALAAGLTALAAIGASAAEAPGLTREQRAADFDAAWTAIDQRYAYLGERRAAWRRAREAWRPRALAAPTRDAFVAALEGALAELHDDRVGLSEASTRAPRRVPADTDIWASWRDGEARIEAVRTFGDADVAGLRPGQSVVRIAGLPVDQAVSERLRGSRFNGPTDRDWALQHELAGPRKGVLRLEVADAQGTRPVAIERSGAARAHGPPLVARRMGEARDIGYLRPRQGLEDARFVAHVEGALEHLRDTRALILDLRDVRDPVAREVTLGILGLFARRETAWQVREAAGGARAEDKVAPRGARPYTAPVVVLVDRWTAGEGEALAAGLKAVAGARLVGTAMAGLRGELAEARLPHSGIAIAFPGERTFHVDGTPRERLRPDVAVDLAAPSGGPGDPILYQGWKLVDPDTPGPRAAR